MVMTRVQAPSVLDLSSSLRVCPSTGLTEHIQTASDPVAQTPSPNTAAHSSLRERRPSVWGPSSWPGGGVGGQQL